MRHTGARFRQSPALVKAGLVDYRLTEVHAKWTLLRCSEMAVTVMATANWNFTRRLEQFVIVEDHALHDGVLAVHQRVWDSGSVERQSATSVSFADLAEKPWQGLSTGPIRGARAPTSAMQAGGPVHWVLTGGLFRRSAIGATKLRRGAVQRVVLVEVAVGFSAHVRTGS